jgi:hypothetical protein
LTKYATLTVSNAEQAEFVESDFYVSSNSAVLFNYSGLFFAHLIFLSAISIRIPIHRMTFTHIEFPHALYLGASGQSSAGFLRQGIRV